MREISLILNILGTIIFFVVPVKLSLIGDTKTNWDNEFPNWRWWLLVGAILLAFSVTLTHH
jgi:hypothetical protein